MNVLRLARVGTARRAGRWAARLAVLALLLAGPVCATAPGPSPLTSAEAVRSDLLRAQLALSHDAASASRFVASATQTYQRDLAGPLAQVAPDDQERAAQGLAAASQALAGGDEAGLATARAQVWTALLAAGYRAVEQSLATGEIAAARSWLGLREFRQATRFSPPDTKATLALQELAAGRVDASEALTVVRADLLDTYQARLAAALHDLAEAEARGFVARQAELAALAEGYFLILASAYAEQRGEAELASTRAAFATLRQAAHDGQALGPRRAAVEAALQGFRAAPLTPAEQRRRLAQLQRFLVLVPMEYARGVSGGVVTRPIELN